MAVGTQRTGIMHRGAVAQLELDSGVAIYVIGFGRFPGVPTTPPWAARVSPRPSFKKDRRPMRRTALLAPRELRARVLRSELRL